MRKRKHMPDIVGVRRIMRGGVIYTVKVYTDGPVRNSPQPMRCKRMKRTSKVSDPHVSTRPVVVQPAGGR